MDEGMQELCAELEIDFEGLYMKIAEAQQGVLKHRIDTWTITFTREELQVISAALEIAGGL